MFRFQMEDLESHIIFEDEQILVLHKPAGIAVQHASVGQMDLESLLKSYLKLKQPNQRREIPYLAIINRLDQPVSGFVLFAKTKEAAKALNRQMTEGEIKKRYLAVVEGRCRQQEERLVDHLVKDGRNHCARIVTQGTKGAKEARLTYHLLEQREKEATVEIILDTGRFHQIRAQMAHAGMPLVGDRKYGSAIQEEPLALCAYSLEFTYPGRKKRMAFELMRSELKRYHSKEQEGEGL